MANDRALNWADLRAAATDELTPAEHAATDLVRRAIESGSLTPLVEAIRAGGQGPENAREALRMLVELDSDRLVQLVLVALARQG